MSLGIWHLCLHRSRASCSAQGIYLCSIMQLSSRNKNRNAHFKNPGILWHLTELCAWDNHQTPAGRLHVVIEEIRYASTVPTSVLPWQSNATKCKEIPEFPRPLRQPQCRSAALVQGWGTSSAGLTCTWLRQSIIGRGAEPFQWMYMQLGFQRPRLCSTIGTGKSGDWVQTLVYISQ